MIPTYVTRGTSLSVLLVIIVVLIIIIKKECDISVSSHHPDNFEVIFGSKKVIIMVITILRSYLVTDVCWSSPACLQIPHSPHYQLLTDDFPPLLPEYPRYVQHTYFQPNALRPDQATPEYRTVTFMETCCKLYQILKRSNLSHGGLL